MTQPLRRYHRYAFFTLAATLPILLAAGLALRPTPLPGERVSDPIMLMLPNGTEMVADSRELWGSAVEEPDALVYWSPGDSASIDGAKFLGSLETARGRGLAVPEPAGFLVLYSLAHTRVVARAPIPKEVP
jgi:hypothetical protein